MRYKGYAKGDVVILQEPLSVPDETEVEIFIPSAEADSCTGQEKLSVAQQTFGMIRSDPLWFVRFWKKICMKLEDLPGGTPIFVDANIFIYHFSGISLECRAFLQRCESRQVEAFPGVHIVLEVMYRLRLRRFRKQT